jgi:hypothetical protein
MLVEKNDTNFRSVFVLFCRMRDQIYGLYFRIFAFSFVPRCNPYDLIYFWRFTINLF